MQTQRVSFRRNFREIFCFLCKLGFGDDSCSNSSYGSSFVVPGAIFATIFMLGTLYAHHLHEGNKAHEMAMLSAIQEAQRDNLRCFNDHMMKVLEQSTKPPPNASRNVWLSPKKLSWSNHMSFSRLEEEEDVLLLDHIKKLLTEKIIHDIVDVNLEEYNSEEVEVVTMLRGADLIERWDRWERLEEEGRKQELTQMAKRFAWADESLDDEEEVMQLSTERCCGF